MKEFNSSLNYAVELIFGDRLAPQLVGAPNSIFGNQRMQEIPSIYDGILLMGVPKSKVC